MNAYTSPQYTNSVRPDRSQIWGGSVRIAQCFANHCLCVTAKKCALAAGETVLAVTEG